MTEYGTDRTSSFQGNFKLGAGGPKEQNYSLNLHTIHLVVLHIFVSMIILVAVIYLDFQCFVEENYHNYFRMIYIRCTFWMVTYIIDIVVKHRHSELRRQGYNDFYSKTIAVYKHLPFSIVTFWNMVILLVQTITMENGLEFPLQYQMSIKSPCDYVCIICGLEAILLGIVHGTYIVKVRYFNRIHSLPDALRDMEQPFIGSLGIPVENVKIADLLEKQADLIYYLKEQNSNLKRKILHINGRINKFASYEEI